MRRASSLPTIGTLCSTTGSKRGGDMSQPRSRRQLAFVLVMATGAMLRAGPALAEPGEDPQPNHGQDHLEYHCTASADIDLNEFFGVDYAIVPYCSDIAAGDRWTPAGGWFMNRIFAAVPPGFEPAGATPREDFLAKFQGVEVVVDAGTSQERTYFIERNERLWIGEHPLVPGLDFAVAIPMGSITSLSIGSHTAAVTWKFAGMHCDGLGDDVQVNCTPGGEYFFGTVSFDVTPSN
jgi:hypothetical protein